MRTEVPLYESSISDTRDRERVRMKQRCDRAARSRANKMTAEDTAACASR